MLHRRHHREPVVRGDRAAALADARARARAARRRRRSATLLDRALADRERGLGALAARRSSDDARALPRRARARRRAPRARRARAGGAAWRASADAATLDLRARRGGRCSRRRCATTRAARSTTTSSPRSSRACAASDPDAAVYWLMRMLEAGEDPLFVARRMVIFAAEDVGNADPQALQVAVAAKDAVPLRRPARGPHPARAGGDVPRDRAQIERVLSRHAGRRARPCKQHGAAARPARAPQRADAAHEGARLRRRLPLPARLRRRAGRAAVPARPLADAPSTSRPIAARRPRSASAWRAARAAKRDPSRLSADAVSACSRGSSARRASRRRPSARGFGRLRARQGREIFGHGPLERRRPLGLSGDHVGVLVRIGARS